ncbi:hypothetical protein BATDEDRAFT_29250 [Batrachochytrium dendrobatidis JAM81]|uniref:NADH:flavin oxidoreductase/NADH oxidase N-terminal domain-containing protein n=2 Tax=Batrachochytrium dendrobatidis TaxID=109871 RepID=F4NVS1_BATDJ|nr:uncharacterized protein BATDEDRAFT_29250 [Batrachochytrium dendrobatidis JAM81]EGF84135.1 hypothetical protein BATDEDRAFT_29250 [Batrachochytrium dendrobatidis JAM81]KAJ8329508.1 hypothetical protein O5D80_002331 [Batrachochytrium dendrobatidis]KAK5668541.1 hypothetical protein QVD99_005554 [Batrachochytrium dendrobatidis]OAJ36706.1 hypothetical protein BDEG_20850 [Batrachochytrium dendrobatidis JEL423]|eukprot:XP_006675632.1 hypothetical protein BATDEDRAFT_29250 [Batrachochytrium dendrobatidis JAM81]
MISSFNGLPPFQAPEPIQVVSTFNAVKQDGVALPLLFTPLKLREVTLKNRVALSPMCMYSCVDGMINMWQIAHLSQYAIQGVGLIIIEATSITPNGRISTGCSGIWSDEQAVSLKQLADFCHTQGAKLGIQLIHAGRKAGYYSPTLDKSKQLHPSIAPEEHGGWPNNIIAPSIVPGWPTDGQSREATLDDIAQVVAAFGAAAGRSHKAGLDVIEIHGAHGYLINQFLSPLTNKRTDRYGGSFENRSRLLIEVCQEVRKHWPEGKPVFVRLSCSDWAEGGWTSDDTVQLAKTLVNFGVDLIDCSSGGNVPHASVSPLHSHDAGWNVPFSEAIAKNASGMHTGVVGGISDPHHAESILQEGKADLILLGRELLRNPIWVGQAAQALGVTVDMPTQYRRGAKPAPTKN